MAKLGRNQACGCGSGRKFKHCCYGIGEQAISPEMSRELARHQAAEAIRKRQQGLGKPIMAIEHGDHQLVFIKNEVMWSKTWKTFPDFLSAYIKRKLGPDWGKEELAKPFGERHLIMQWWDAYSRLQKASVTKAGGINSCEVNGAVQCYLGLAYSLYLMAHNADLQDRMIARLKDIGQFQGAFYEMLVANALIRAGYELVLEDEADRKSRHCEFAAIKSATSKRYTVEAKSRAVAGFLGRTAKDGGTDERPLGRLKGHLHDALDKPSAHDRLVFIDLNAPVDLSNDKANEEVVVRAADQLEHYQGHPDAPKPSAYVFITNMAFHRHLEARPISVIAPIGFRIPDFNKAAPITVIEKYRQDKKHQDAYDIARSLHSLHEFPATFDGTLPSETLHGEPQRILIGEKYEFVDPEGPIVGVVRSATVVENTREVWVSVETERGHQMHREKMTDAAFDEWRNNKAAYFGEIQDVPSHAKTPYEMYRRFMEMFADYDRKALALQIGKAADDPGLAHMSDVELREQISNGLLTKLLDKNAEKKAG